MTPNAIPAVARRTAARTTIDRDTALITIA
jgi:hypothetical protein